MAEPARSIRNTPASVLAYIDAIWRQNEPPSEVDLARELGYTPKGFRRLKEKHGGALIVYLLKVKQSRTEEPRFMARQHGRIHLVQYVSSQHGAISDAEAVSDSELKRYRENAKRKEAGALESMIFAMEDVRSALDERCRENPDLAREIAKELWQIRGRIDAAKAKLRRRMAA